MDSEAKLEFKSNSKRSLILSIIFGCLVICGAVVFAVIWTVSHSDDDDCPSRENPLKEDVYKSGHGTYKYAAVAADSATCSNVGKEILARRRGNAVDAVVASMLCTGVLASHSMGLGGGSFFVIYDKKTGTHAFDAREIAPGASDSQMFVNKKGQSLLGGLAIAVPGQVKGLWDIHQRFGSIPWKNVVKPTIKLTQDGFHLTEAMHKALLQTLEDIEKDSGFDVFLDNNKQPKPAGSIIKMPKLARTLEIIADDPMSFYNGSLAKDIVDDIQERGGIITLEDLKSYTVSRKQPTQIKLPGNITVYSMPPPGSGVVLSYILSILAGYNMDANSVATNGAKILTYHRIVEAMKFAYALRSALGDEDFVDVRSLILNMTSRSYAEGTRLLISDDKTQDVTYYHPSYYNIEDSGTSHMSVIDGEGNAVSVTSTINTKFGSKVMGKRTGIIFNNEMDDFSTPNLTNHFGVPPSKSNFIEPGKRPQSSMSPAIVWDDTEGKVRMLVGAAGGTKITTTTAWLIQNVIYFKKSIPEAMDLPRIHHQLMPNEIAVEKDLSPEIRAGLNAKGHKITEREIIAIAQAIDVLKDTIVAVSDYRKGGQPGGY